MSPAVLRSAAAGRAAYGLFLLTMPRRLLAAGALDRTPDWAPGIVRLLGARHLLQAAAITARPGLAGPGSLVDLSHASTDVACAGFVPAMRAPALLDAAVATGLALSSFLIPAGR
jgi:hypothetical protein